jgi:long-chain acyl-CoA synthetase
MRSLPYQNLAEAQRRQAERFGPRPALRYKHHGLFHDLTWIAYREASAACAAALIGAGIRPGERVGLLSENRLEWLIADMGILTAGAVNVPPHAPLTAKQVAYQFADAGIRWVFVSNAEQLEKVALVLHELPELKGIVAFEARAAAAADYSVPAFAWDFFLQRGRQEHLETELRRREAELKPDDLATIMYTSGTTGNPKGVMLTHRNLLSNADAIVSISPHRPNDVVLSWLPYSHIFARTVDHYLSIVDGVMLALAESVDTLVENLMEVRPTHMAAVPRFYEKVLASVTVSDSGHTAARLRHVFGPRIDWLMSGGAALPYAVAKAYLDAGLHVLQGYGLTETSPVITYNRPEHFKLETVGVPLPDVEVKIGPDGEVLTRGPHVMPGYWNNAQATTESIRDGWFHTGDLGRVDADGFLSITGRKKELMILSSGKKLVPNHIEGLLLGDACIDQAVIYGEGRNFVTALIVPNWTNLRRVMQQAGTELDHKPPEELAIDPRVYTFLDERIQKALVDVSGWEHVKKFVVLPQPFSVAKEELTVSLKLRRNVVFDHYGERLEALYEGDTSKCSE